MLVQLDQYIKLDGQGVRHRSGSQDEDCSPLAVDAYYVVTILTNAF